MRVAKPERAAGPPAGERRRWWLTRLTRERERKLYFLATVVLAVWYLASRLL